MAEDKFTLFKLADKLSGLLKESAVDEQLEKNAEREEIAELSRELKELKEKIDNSLTKEKSGVEKLSSDNKEDDSVGMFDDDSLGEPDGHSKLSSGDDNCLSEYLQKYQ